MWPSVAIVYEDTSAIAVFNKQTLVYRAVKGVESKVVRLDVCSVVNGWLTGRGGESDCGDLLSAGKH